LSSGVEESDDPGEIRFVEPKDGGPMLLLLLLLLLLAEFASETEVRPVPLDAGQTSPPEARSSPVQGPPVNCVDADDPFPVIDIPASRHRSEVETPPR